MKTVRPCCVQISKPWFDPCLEIIDLWEYCILFISSLCSYQCKIVVLPEFTPNDKMLKLHADKGKEDWEIFAECVRNVICK